MSDLTLPAAKAERDALADRTDVLDRVGVLASLPDDFNSTTAMVAEFYQVDREALLKLVQRNRDELDEDGFQILGRSEVVDKLSMTPDDLGMPKTSPSLSLFPRRAVLRIGMLLRDSPVARQIRDYLLNAEQSARRAETVELTEDQIVHRALHILDSKVKELTATVEASRPAVEYFETHVVVDDDVMLVEDWGRAYGLTKPQSFELLRDEKQLIYKKSFERWSRKHGCKITEVEYRPRAGKPSFTWFDVKEQRDAPRRNNGQARKTMYIKAIHAVDLARLVGLLPNLEAAS